MIGSRPIAGSKSTTHVPPLNPEAMLEDVCRFLRVPFDREMFRDGLEHYQAVHVGQWQLELPDIDNQVSNVFRGMLRRFGYESAAVARTA